MARHFAKYTDGFSLIRRASCPIQGAKRPRLVGSIYRLLQCRIFWTLDNAAHAFLRTLSSLKPKETPKIIMPEKITSTVTSTGNDELRKMFLGRSKYDSPYSPSSITPIQIAIACLIAVISAQFVGLAGAFFVALIIWLPLAIIIGAFTHV